jgi:hypothetical protein
MPIQGFKLTTEDDTFDLPDPPEVYGDRLLGGTYTTRDGLAEYEER